MKSENYFVRPGKAEDVPFIFDLITELAVYEKAGNEVTNTREKLLEDGFGKDPIYGLFVVENHLRKIIGMALYYTKYSTWKGRCLFLEDIIVTEEYRGQGIGAILFEEVIRVARDEQAGRMEWQVLEWNEPAIRFYNKYGATLDPEWLNGKFTQDQLQSFQKTEI